METKEKVTIDNLIAKFGPGAVLTRNVLTEKANVVAPIFAILPSNLNERVPNSPGTLLGISSKGILDVNIYANSKEWKKAGATSCEKVYMQLALEGYSASVTAIKDPEGLSSVRLMDIKKGNKPVYVPYFNNFDKIIARTNSHTKWFCSFYSHYDPTTQIHFAIGNVPLHECLPYEGNERLINTKCNPA